MDESNVAAFEALPRASSCRLIDFDDARILPGLMLRTYFLIVKGTKPWITMDVALHPLLHGTRPDFACFEVVGSHHAIGLPQAAAYSATLDITHLMGIRGIEVIGASARKKIEVS